MQILYVDFVGSGGMLHYAESLTAAMSKIALGSLALPRKDNGSIPPRLRWLDKLKTKYNPAYYRSLADDLINRYKPDLVHISSKSIGLRPFISHLRHNGVAVVYTIHDPSPHEENVTLWGRIVEHIHYSLQTPWILEHCSAIHVHSASHANELVGRYGKSLCSRTYVVPHGGGAPEAIQTGTKEPPELTGTNHNFSFLFFGRIEPYKGLPVLTKAFMKVLDNFPMSRLIIAGAGIIEMCSLGPHHNVLLINRFIADAEIRTVFERSNVVVLPYLSATQTGVIPLAYEFSKPVICSSVGGLPEMVLEGHTGIIVTPGDVAALTHAMATMAQDPERTKTMGEHGRVYMKSHFSWDMVAAQHRQAYLNILDRS